MEIRDMKKEEQMYCYSMKTNDKIASGLIGHLRMDFGATGNMFYSTWWEFSKERKTDKFRAEFDAVINSFRGIGKNPQGKFLKSREEMRKFCREHLNGRIVDEVVGLRVDTEDYTYMFRLNPVKGDYNMYCYCYIREMLEKHMNKAE